MSTKELFESIAKRYDFANKVLSFGMDFYWRQYTIKKARIMRGFRVADFGTGTGKLAKEITGCVGEDGEVIGIDISKKMVEIAKKKNKSKNLKFIIANAEKTGLKSGYFDCSAAGFVLRNTGNEKNMLSEMQRVTRKGGKIIILEFCRPKKNITGRAYKLYLKKIVPSIGGLISKNKQAYRHLSSSILDFYSRKELEELLRSQGLKNVKSYPLAFEAVAVVVGEK